MVFSVEKFSKLIITLIIPVPPKGLVVYCGTIMTDEGKEKKVTIDFEPFKPINTSLYLCDNKVDISIILQKLTSFSCLTGLIS